MNTRNIVVIVLSACFLLGIGAVAVQRHQIATLRDEQQRIQNEIAALGVQPSDFTATPQLETSEVPTRPPLKCSSSGIKSPN